MAKQGLYVVTGRIETFELDSIRKYLDLLGINEVRTTELKRHPPFAYHGSAAVKEPSPELKLEVLVEGEERKDAVADVILRPAIVRGVERDVFYHKVERYKPLI